MFKKLRWNFLWVSTLVLLLVICAVVGIVYWTTSHTVMSQTRVLMDLILENDGKLPDQGEFDPRQETFLALNAESVNEIRYYTALVSGEDVQIVDTHILVREEDAASIARGVSRKKSDYGSIAFGGNRRMNYARRINEDGSELIVVLDSTSRYALIRVVMIYMTALWGLVLILYVVLMSRYSKKVIRPFVENDERQKRFITNASHELKTPLAVISANTEMTEATAGASKWTESTRRQVGKLQSLIEDLVVLSRLDEMQELSLTEMDLSAVTAETAGSFRSVIEGSGRRCEIDVAPGVTGKAEKRSWQQLVSILIDNAAKYCDENGEVRVTLHSKKRGKGAKLTVSNTYAGGKDVDTSRFFERFYREDESHNSARPGFGVGLSMGREIAERMKGKLTVSYAGDTISFTAEL